LNEAEVTSTDQRMLKDMNKPVWAQELCFCPCPWHNCRRETSKIKKHKPQKHSSWLKKKSLLLPDCIEETTVIRWYNSSHNDSFHVII